MSYSDLSIGEGESAMVTFAYLAMGRYEGERAEAERQNLLQYCKRDTLAMVKLHERLDEFVREDQINDKSPRPPRRLRRKNDLGE